MDIQEYLWIEGVFDSYQINYRLKKTLIALSSGIVPFFIPSIIKTTSSISNVSRNNFPHAPSNSHTQGIQGYRKELTNLAKIYIDEAKYSGKNDSFTFKLTIFRDIFARADVLHEIKLKAFPTMLTGLDLGYYYSNVSIRNVVIFNEVCDLIQTYFERAEYRKKVLSGWKMTTLKSVMKKNRGKPMEECLHLLIKDLCHLQHRSDVEICTEKFIHNRLIHTSQDVTASQYEYFKPADGLAGLINDPRFSIITFQKANTNNTQTQAFFTDQRYHKQYHSPLSAYAQRNRGDHGRNNQAQIGKKKCFACNKKGCWSSKHTMEERQESKKKFKKWSSQGFDKQVSQYIAE